MLLTKTIIMKWGKNRLYYESRGYIFTKWKDKFEVKVEDLKDGSNVLVEIKCDNPDCDNPILKTISYENYKKYVHENGKYYCPKCGTKLFGKEKANKTKLKKSKSFEQWCYDNLSTEKVEGILNKWDYELNKCSPSEVCYSSMGINKKGYWFKCLEHPEHHSELKSIASFTRKNNNQLTINCNQCNLIAITHPELIKYFVNEEDVYKYSVCSNVKVKMKCPECGYERLLIISSLILYGFSCPKCSDGISYPNKLMFNILEQLRIEFINEYSPVWIKPKRYDFYFELNNKKYILEMDGLQHKKECGFKITLQEQNNIDKYKDKLAKENGVKIIRIDCKKSDLEFIKKNILDSELAKLFDLSKIDWLKCHEYACKSLIKVACDLWNNGMESTKAIADKLKIGRDTVIGYLKQGAKIKLCNYNVEEEIKKNIISLTERNIKKVICLNTKEIFNSIKDGSVKYGIKGSNGIIACCKGATKSAGKNIGTEEPLQWMYYDDYLNGDIPISLIKIICINTGETFNSIKSIKNRYNNISLSGISKCCCKKQKSAGKHPITGEKMVWMYYEDYIKLQEII